MSPSSPVDSSSATTPSAAIPRRPNANKRGGRIDTSNYELRKRGIQKPQLAPNHFYISSKQNLQNEADRIEKLLQKEMREVHIHGTSSSIVRAMSVVARVEVKLAGAISRSMRTSTVTARDDMFPLTDEAESSSRTRPLSAIHIKLTRLSPL